MIKKVNKDCKIFENGELYKDRYLFYGMMSTLDNSNDMYSDDNNYLIVYDKDSSNIWIWTKDNIDNMSFLMQKFILSDIKKVINLYPDNFTNNIICKPSLYQLLSKNFLNQPVEKLTCMVCNNLTKPKECDGSIYIPSDNALDIDVLRNIYFEYSYELYGKDSISLESSKVKVKQMIENGSLYAWKNNKGEIVSMVDCQDDNNFGVLTSLYTREYERGKGYGSNLIYTLTKEIKESERKPIIYVESGNSISMNIYQKIGYETKGEIYYIANSPLKTNYKGGKLK